MSRPVSAPLCGHACTEAAAAAAALAASCAGNYRPDVSAGSACKNGRTRRMPRRPACTRAVHHLCMPNCSLFLINNSTHTGATISCVLRRRCPVTERRFAPLRRRTIRSRELVLSNSSSANRSDLMSRSLVFDMWNRVNCPGLRPTDVDTFSRRRNCSVCTMRRRVIDS